jgi:hypothetical protein
MTISKDIIANMSFQKLQLVILIFLLSNCKTINLVSGSRNFPSDLVLSKTEFEKLNQVKRKFGCYGNCEIKVVFNGLEFSLRLKLSPSWKKTL